MPVIALLLLAASCTILAICSSILARSFVKVASYFRINEFAAGFIIASASSALPNIFVGLMAAAEGQPLLSLGNSIGANVFGMTLTLGAVALLSRRITIKSRIIRKDLLYMFAMVLAPVVLMADDALWARLGLYAGKGISRIDGLLLLALYGLYIWNILGQEKIFRRTPGRTAPAIQSTIIIALLVLLLMISAKTAVASAEGLSAELSMPLMLTGLFGLAICTGLPGLVFATRAAASRREGLAFGDIIGSVVANSTLVVGITAVIHPIFGSIQIYFIGAMFMILASLLFVAFAESEKGLTWKEGMILIMLYMFFIIIELYAYAISSRL